MDRHFGKGKDRRIIHTSSTCPTNHSVTSTMIIIISCSVYPYKVNGVSFAWWSSFYFIFYFIFSCSKVGFWRGQSECGSHLGTTTPPCPTYPLCFPLQFGEKGRIVPWECILFYPWYFGNFTNTSWIYFFFMMTMSDKNKWYPHAPLTWDEDVFN